MKLDEALRMGAFCGLSTVGEAISNVYLHAGQFMAYSEINEEFDELTKDLFLTYGDLDINKIKIPQHIIDAANLELEDYYKEAQNAESNLEY